MPLTPEVRRLLDAMASLGLPDISETSVAKAREYSKLRAATLPPGPDALVQNTVAATPSGKIALRTYRPLGVETPLPVLLWMHGGGFVLGDLEQADADCRSLATQAQCMVISVDYPLAPEHPFPAAPQSCYEALCWVYDAHSALRIDRQRMAVGGDSAGGNLAAAVALQTRQDSGPALCHQLLVYPIADLTRFDTASYIDNAEGYFLTRRAMRWFRDQYIENAEDAAHPLASPLLIADVRGLPPAHVIVAEYDPLRDEGEALGRKLQAGGVPVQLNRYDGMIHGFFTMSGYLPQGRDAVNEAAKRLRVAFDA